MKRNIAVALILVTVITGLMNSSCDPATNWEKDERRQIEDFIATRGDTVFERNPADSILFHLLKELAILPIRTILPLSGLPDIFSIIVYLIPMSVFLKPWHSL